MILAVLLFSLNNSFPTKEINDDEVIVRENSLENSELSNCSSEKFRRVIILSFFLFPVEKLKNLGKNDLAEELSGQYQGDIIISERQLRDYQMKSNTKTGLLNTRYHWQNRTVPYRVIESHFSK